MKKILYFIIGFVLILSISYILFYIPNFNKIKQDIYLEKTQEMRITFAKEIQKEQANANSIVFLLSQDISLIEALEQNNSKNINFDKTIGFLDDNTHYRNLWIQIIDIKGDSFYRSWAKERGDSIIETREDIVELLKNPKPLQNLSSGIYDLTLKSIYPIFGKDNNFLGFIEIISNLNSIASSLKYEKIDPIFILSDKKSKKLKNPYSKIFIKDNYIANTNANKDILKIIENYGINNFKELKDYIQVDKYLVTNLEIKDLKGDNLGLFLMFFDKNNLDFNSLTTFKNLYLTFIVIFLLFYGLIFLYFIKLSYAKELNIEVQNKTRLVEEQQKKLEKLLEIYDKNVIFSKTDLNGIITHASSAFCKISGFKKDELIGKPHNIVRHPDTTKSIFKYIWEELKSQNKVSAEIKNARRDGSFYWVAADFEPEYNEQNKHIGYFSIREDITANKEIEELQSEIIFTMGSIAEFRSKETGEHIKRVAKYSKILAIAYGLNKEISNMLELASPMHDIGKIAISDEILNKPAKLTLKEFEIMKTHAQKGYDMLHISNRPLFKMAAQIALTHHEKYNGSGYPNGLKGEEISIFGRITALADVFDALGSDRCYKKAWKIEHVLEYIKEQSGKHFDPKLVEVFFENIDQILKIREEHRDT